jgi:hypothetical protein
LYNFMPHQSQDENEPASSLQNNICQNDFAFVSNIFIFRTCRNSEILFFLNLRILVSIAPGSARLLPAKTPRLHRLNSCDHISVLVQGRGLSDFSLASVFLPTHPSALSSLPQQMSSR